MSNENDPAAKPEDDEALRAPEALPPELDADPSPPAAADASPVPIETAPVIKVETGSRGRSKQMGRRREKSPREPLPDFDGLESPAEDPERTPDPSETMVPIVEVRSTSSTPARNRTGSRRANRGSRPEKIDFGTTATSEPQAGPSDEDAESDASQTRNNRQASRPRPAAKLPASPRSVAGTRRAASPKSWSIVVAVCGVSAVAVVVLLVFLLNRPPADLPATAQETASGEPEATRPANASNLAQVGVPPRRSAAERSGVRGYSQAEAAQRRQGIDSFAEMGRSEESQLHRGQWLEPGPQLGHEGQIQAAPLDLTRGLLAHWAFETKSHDQAADDSLHEHPARLDGKPASTATGAVGLALRLDGKDDSVRVPDGLLKGAVGTLALWLRTRDRAEPKVFVSSAERSAVFSLRLVAGQFIAGAPHAGSEPIAVAVPRWPGNWQHIAVTWQSGGQVVLYLDGLPLGQQPAGPLSDPTGVVIGRDAASDTCSAFDVDEIRLFDRVLSAAEIAELAARR